MLCKVKERLDHDYRFVFELISPSRRVYMLQAEHEDDFIAWCSVLEIKFIILENIQQQLVLKKVIVIVVVVVLMMIIMMAITMII